MIAVFFKAERIVAVSYTHLGVNFGAGMTGGFAYVLDESGDFRKRVNPELVEVLSVDDLAIHEEHLSGLITEHVQHTGSQRGEEILANWSTFATK